MRRFVTLALILVFSIPVGLSISGCAKHTVVSFCNGGSSGEQEGQVTSINLEPRLYGISLNYGSIGQVGSPSAEDCKGSPVGVVKYTYGTTNITYADISPSGSICAGTWNRNSPGGVADYTTCSPPSSTLPLPSFSTPTSPTVTTGATSTLNYGVNPNGVNGTIDISLGGIPLTGTIANTTTAAGFVTAFNAIGAFSTNHIVATSSGNIVTVTGPAGVTNTLSFAGTNLAGAGFLPVAYITASVGGAVSNAVPVYVHPIVTNVQLTNQSACFSQGVSTPLNATVTANVNGVPTDITALAGPLSFLPQDGSVLSINSTVIPPVATAQLPGSTIVSANTSNASSPAGTFYTCPPQSITLSVPNPTPPNTSTSLQLNQNTPQALTVKVVDTNNTVITGLNLEFVSTSPNTVSATSGGSITANYPGAGSITAICQPSTCNPSPLNQLGIHGNGLPITSNPIAVTTPGTVNTVLYMASTNSQYFTTIDFYTNALGAPIRLPYVPNSMIPDALGQVLYFGSPSELMEVSTLTNSLTKEDASVKGTVVGVSNDGSALVMSDAVHNLIYIYYTASGTSTSFGGTATHAQFTPDNQSVYITGSNSAGNNLFVYSIFTGWHSYTLPNQPTDVAVTAPAIGAYLAGPTTNARSYCSTGTPPTTSPVDTFYPPATTPQSQKTDRIAATNDGKHILGATATGNFFTDFSITLPSAGGANNPGACPSSGAVFTTTPYPQAPLGVTATAITGVFPKADSSVAFVTYTGTGGKLPLYTTSSTGVGVMSQVTLNGTATAAVSGVFAPDGNTFYTGTAGDNLVHIIAGPTAWTDSATQVHPSLPICTTEDATGNCTVTGTGFATPNLVAVRVRPTT